MCSQAGAWEQGKLGKHQYNGAVMEVRRLPRLDLLSCKLKRSEESNSISHHIGA
ncbi:unnamed protein product [Chrysoparadoxa australica]